MLVFRRKRRASRGERKSLFFATIHKKILVGGGHPERVEIFFSGGGGGRVNQGERRDVFAEKSMLKQEGKVPEVIGGVLRNSKERAYGGLLGKRRRLSSLLPKWEGAEREGCSGGGKRFKNIVICQEASM